MNITWASVTIKIPATVYDIILSPPPLSPSSFNVLCSTRFDSPDQQCDV